MVKCKYANRKSIHYLIFVSNSTFYPICHDLRDNRARTCKILTIRIFELKIEGQGHEEQHAVLRHYMANCVAYQIAARIAGLS